MKLTSFSVKNNKNNVKSVVFDRNNPYVAFLNFY